MVVGVIGEGVGGCQRLCVVSAIFGERCDGKRQKLAAQTVRQR